MMKKLLKITEIARLPNNVYLPTYQRYRFQILIAQIHDLIKDFVKILCSYLLYFPRNKPSKSATVGIIYNTCLI